MKKLIVAVVLLIVVAAAGLAWCWNIREPKDFRRTDRREALKTLRTCKAEEIIPYLEKLSSERMFRAWFDDDKFSLSGFHCAYETKVPADFIAQLAEEAFIRFSGNGAPDSEDVPNLKKMLEFSVKAMAACTTAAAADSLRLRRLDGFFLTKDYDGAVAELERGIPGQSPEWCKGTIAKLRAHQALDKGDKKAAIENFLEFGKFMQGDSMKDFEDCDPTTGVVYSREWVVGRTFLRCSKLAEEIGDAIKAKEYRDAAKPYMDTALDKAKDDARSINTLKKEIESAGL